MSFHRLLAISLTLITTGVQAQEPPSKGDLTEGLMDLLKEPNKPPATVPNQPASPQANPQANPLAEVELGMQTLARLLRARPDATRPDATRTRQLQRDVVLRLDEMIGQLEKQSPSSSQSGSSSQQSGSSQSSSSANAQPQSNAAPSSENQQTMPRPSNQRNAGQSNDGRNSESDAQPGQQPPASPGDNNRPSESSSGNESASSTSQPGVSPMRARNVTVDLNDPRALQRSAWGNLPERTREQMQSRMVERFLPPYREEIEAYYRALVK